MRPPGTRVESTLGAKARERRRGTHPESSRTPGMEVSGPARRAVGNGGGHGGGLPAPVPSLHSHRHPSVPSHAPRHCARQHLAHPPIHLVQRMPHSRHCPRSGLRHTPLATASPVAVITPAPPCLSRRSPQGVDGARHGTPPPRGVDSRQHPSPAGLPPVSS